MLILLAGWACYFTLHSLLAAVQSKQWFYRQFPQVPARYYRIFYNIIFLAGILVLAFFQLTLPSDKLFTPTLLINIIAGIICISGLLIMSMAIKNYHTKSFLGIIDVYSEPLQVSGLNKYMRHPLYTGTSLFVTGVFLFFPFYKHLYFLLLYFVYLIIGMWLEEKKLVHIYGDEYRKYQQRVKKLIPGLW